MTAISPAALTAFASEGLPRLLFITHAWGGGVEQHVRSTAARLSAIARVAILRPCDATSVELALPGGERYRIASTNWPMLVAALQALHFDRLHLHHTHGFSRDILDLDRALGVPQDCSLHDFASICPQYQLNDSEGRYCREPDEAGCNRCIHGRPHPWSLDIAGWRAAWAATLRRADHVIAPSQSVANTVRRYLPDLAVKVIPHAESSIVPPRVVKVALLGALSQSKGLAVARAVADFAEQTGSPLVLRLIGHAAEPLPKNLSATGSYEADELPRLMAMERPDVLWLPVQVPETFSFTLSTAIASKLPIVASDFGAFPERLKGIENVTLLPFDSSTKTWHDALLLRSASHADSASDADHSVKPQTTNYAETYGASLLAHVPQANPTLMAALLERSRLVLSPVQDTPRALLDVFRIGVYGGHRPSVEVIENQLANLPVGERELAGQSAYASLFEESAAMRHSLAIAEQQRDEVSRALVNQETAHAEESIRWRRALDDADDRAQAARDHIDHLEIERSGLQKHNARLDAQLAELWSSTSWRITRPLRAVVNRLHRLRHAFAVTAGLVRRAPSLAHGGMARYRRGGWRSVRDRFAIEFQKSSAPVVAIALPSADAVAIEALTLPTVAESPVVSIVIPVYGQHPTTFACLKSIAEEPPRHRFEVIIMDDCSPEAADTALASVQGVRIVRNESNLGFIGNVNAGALASRGQWLIILNNDTVVRPEALNAMLDTFEQHSNVGLVGAKLLNADGTVQEAGGIVWRDGSAWNWGRGQDREHPRFNFVRDADYCSGAALAIRRDLFLEMGGFDTHYSPAYFEDTDLAFRIRARGLRVLYQPAAEVFHLEGVSHGRSESSGIKAYQVTNGKKFFERWQAALATHRENAVEPDLEAHRSSVSNILIVEACMITPDQDSGSVRLLNLLKMLKADGHHVTFVADNLDGDPKYAALLTSIGVEVLHGRFAGSVRKVLRDRGSTYDAIVFCRHYIASRYIDVVRSLAPKAKIIFDTVDLHFVREQREAALHNNAAMARASEVTRAKELHVIAQSDVTIVVSDFERNLLAEIAPRACVEIISNIHADTPDRSGSSARSGILFVGGFRHPPNIDAVTWYANEVLPFVRQALPDVVTTIVGSNMPDSLKQLAREGLEMCGYVPDTAPLLRSARVSIAPLRYGAGVKGKINEAMNYGVPVVATACAVEGMKLNPEEGALVADSAEAFATAIVRLHRDADLWQRLSLAGIANVDQHFSPEAALPSVRAVFGGLKPA